MKLSSAFVLLALFAFPAFAEINYNDWKLTLPIDSKGGFASGKAIEVKPLKADYSKPPYYYKEDDAIIFSVPANGATTSGSKYPRSELREMSDGKEASWKISDGGTLSATLSVESLPTTKDGKPGRIVIGQIHGPDDELCRLYYDNGKLYFYDDKAGEKKKETKFDLKNKPIPLHEPFGYIIMVADNKLTVTAIYNGEIVSVSEETSSFWKDKPLYFKAGVYSQVGKIGSSAGTTGTGIASARFYDIALSHPKKDPGGCVCP